MFDFAKVKATIGALAGELKSLRAEKETLLQRREEMEAQPICKSDLLELIDDFIDRRGLDFPAKLEAGLSFYMRHPLATLPENKRTPGHPMAVLTAVADANGMATLQSLENSMFYVLRDSIKAGVREAVEQIDFTAAGPQRVERLETIKAIDNRIDELNEAEQALISQAEESGLRL